MSIYFKRAWEFTKRWEGGYVNDPNDPGGETNYGISKKAHPDVDVKNLTEDQAAEIYYRDYWLKAECEGKPVGLAVALFDSAVNCGVSRTLRWLKQSRDEGDLLARRKEHYDLIVQKNPKLKKFTKGWFNRLAALHIYIGHLAEEVEPQTR